MSSVESITDAVVYEDLNILSDKYKLSVLYSKESGIDLSVFTAHATEISGNPYIYEELDITGQEFAYHSSNGYIYFLASEYATVSTLASGSAFLNFWYYSFDTKQETLAFTIKVYGSGTPTGGITKENLAKLYSSSLKKDYNQNDIYKIMYDNIPIALYDMDRHPDLQK